MTKETTGLEVLQKIIDNHWGLTPSKVLAQAILEAGFIQIKDMDDLIHKISERVRGLDG